MRTAKHFDIALVRKEPRLVGLMYCTVQLSSVAVEWSLVVSAVADTAVGGNIYFHL
jgi:hypothetical protein